MCSLSIMELYLAKSFNVRCPIFAFVTLDLVSDMLGSDKYKLSWQTVLDSFQNPYINR